MVQFVRTLYGSTDIGLTSDVLGEVVRTFKSKHAKFNKEQIVYFTLGIKNTDRLAKLGAKHIVQVDKDHSVNPNGSFYDYNKLVLMIAAMESFESIIYMDFDVSYTKNFDPAKAIESVLQDAEKKKCGILMPSVAYKNPRYWWRGNNGKTGRDKISGRKGVIGCFIFLQNYGSVFTNILDDYKEMMELWGHKICKPRHILGDEQVMMYRLEKIFGALPVGTMAEKFEPEIIQCSRSALNGLGYPSKDFMFTHR